MSQAFTYVSGFSAVILASIHLLAARVTFLNAVPRSRWLSFAGGVAASYIFVHLFPELAERQAILYEANNSRGILDEHMLYLMALVGLCTYYGVERIIEVKNESDKLIYDFELHIASFAAYNLLIGYILAGREQTILQLLFYLIAIGFHFLSNDIALYRQHQEQYSHQARWILALAIIVGWGLAFAFPLPEVIVSFFFAFLAGGMILNIMKEELPKERESRFSAFIIGAGSYTLLLLLSDLNIQ